MRASPVAGSSFEEISSGNPTDAATAPRSPTVLMTSSINLGGGAVTTSVYVGALRSGLWFGAQPGLPETTWSRERGRPSWRHKARAFRAGPTPRLALPCSNHRSDRSGLPPSKGIALRGLGSEPLSGLSRRKHCALSALRCLDLALSDGCRRANAEQRMLIGSGASLQVGLAELLHRRYGKVPGRRLVTVTGESTDNYGEAPARMTVENGDIVHA